MSLVSIALVVHVLAATFWAGSTFTLARTQGKSADQLFVPQMGAAAVAVVAGVFVWREALGAGDHAVLGAGSLAALLAAIVQAVVVGRARRRIATEPAALARALLAHRVAAGLLVVTIVCMVVQ